MIFIVLICTLIGYLCGSALAGLGAGLAFWAWANYTPPPRRRPRKRRRLRK